jgi:hypothetical protein
MGKNWNASVHLAKRLYHSSAANIPKSPGKDDLISQNNLFKLNDANIQMILQTLWNQLFSKKGTYASHYYDNVLELMKKHHAKHNIPSGKQPEFSKGKIKELAAVSKLKLPAFLKRPNSSTGNNALFNHFEMMAFSLASGYGDLAKDAAGYCWSHADINGLGMPKEFSSNPGWMFYKNDGTFGTSISIQ